MEEMAITLCFVQLDYNTGNYDFSRNSKADDAAYSLTVACSRYASAMPLVHRVNTAPSWFN